MKIVQLLNIKCLPPSATSTRYTCLYLFGHILAVVGPSLKDLNAILHSETAQMKYDWGHAGLKRSAGVYVTVNIMIYLFSLKALPYCRCVLSA